MMGLLTQEEEESIGSRVSRVSVAAALEPELAESRAGS
jgi:hypothetical protein